MKRLLIAFLALTGVATAGNGYAWGSTVTVGASVVPSPQTNFPMVISTTNAKLATVANGGQVQNTTTLNGAIVPADLIVTSDPSGVNLLNWEVASYTATSGAIEIWVRIPSLSNGTVFYLWAGKASVTTYQGNPHSVWDSNFQGVWHLPNGSTLSANDSTGNSNNGSAGAATATTGKIDGAANFTSTTAAQVVTVSSPSSGLTNICSGTTACTFEAWMDASAWKNFSFLLFAGAGAAGKGGGLVEEAAHQIALVINDSNVADCTAATIGSWQHIVFTRTGTTYNCYTNGVVSNGTFASDTSWGTHYVIGGIYNATPSLQFLGAIDEARISSTARSASWIATEYNNQSSPSTFYTIQAGVSMGAHGTAVAVIM